MRAKGIDISKYQVTFEPKGNIDFIIQRASYGLNKDEKYNQLLPGVKTIERRGAYHYFYTGIDPVAQAEFFYNTQGGQGFKFLVVDYESTGNVLNAQGAENLLTCLSHLELMTDKPILLYTSPYVYKDKVLAHWGEPAFPLWIAHYKDPAGEPETWGNPWKFWQYTSEGDGAEYGVGSTHVDLNVFNGTVAELDAWLGIIEQPPVDCCEELREDVIHWFTETDGNVEKNLNEIHTLRLKEQANAAEIEKATEAYHVWFTKNEEAIAALTDGLVFKNHKDIEELQDSIAGLQERMSLNELITDNNYIAFNEQIADLESQIEDITIQCDHVHPGWMVKLGLVKHG